MPPAVSLHSLGGVSYASCWAWQNAWSDYYRCCAGRCIGDEARVLPTFAYCSHARCERALTLFFVRLTTGADSACAPQNPAGRRSPSCNIKQQSYPASAHFRTSDAAATHFCELTPLPTAASRSTPVATIP